MARVVEAAYEVTVDSRVSARIPLASGGFKGRQDMRDDLIKTVRALRRLHPAASVDAYFVETTREHLDWCDAL